MTELDAAQEAFSRLREERLDNKTAAEWDLYYHRMAPFLAHPEATIRHSALERLSMAVMRAEKMSFRLREPRPEDPGAILIPRLRWLLSLVEEALSGFPDMGRAFLEELRYHGDDEPFQEPLREWLRVLLTSAPEDIPRDLIRGTLVLIGDCGSRWEEAAPQWLQLLDDPSAYVRGCAAHMLGKECDADTNPDTEDLFAIIKPKEIARPGIAGPFWSGLQFADGDFPDVIEWMMDILEQRQGDEPEGMPFNGVDFHLHELCYGSLGAIERMVKSGHKRLALETATEAPGVIEGMEEILIQLGSDEDEEFARGAWEHLARYYRILHPKAIDGKAVLAMPQWDVSAEAFVIRQGDDAAWRDVMVIYPKEAGGSMDDRQVWKLVNRALPEALRGPQGRDTLSVDPAGSPYRLGDSLHYEFERGPIVTLEGDPDRKLWRRVEIVGRGLQGRWEPRSSAST